jgi:hypothetical protein
MKIFYLLLFFLVLSCGAFAQDTIVVTRERPHEYKAARERSDKPPMVNRFYYGGYLNLTFGSYTALGIEPLVAYKINPRLSFGTILTYEYVSDKTHPGYTYSASNYGASLFSRFRVIPQIYLHTEFSEMYYESYKTGGYRSRYMVPFLFVGGGYSQQLSENTWFNTQILFDVIQNENSPYKNWVPFYSIGFGVGF